MKIVIFDVDGVLLDSLSPHLRICLDLANEYDLNISIPSKKKFKNEIVRKHIKISPMYDFFVSVGFLPDKAKEATKYYDENFNKLYGAKMFNGIEAMIHNLKEDGFDLGIVTSNVRQNILPPLQTVLTYFEDDAILTYDDPKFGKNKEEAIDSVIDSIAFHKQEERIDPKQIWYIGDQWKDHQAANKAGVNFIGVTYGWCIAETDYARFPIANNPEELYNILTGN